MRLYRIKPRYRSKLNQPPATEAVRQFNHGIWQYRLPWHWVEFMVVLNGKREWQALIPPSAGIFNMTASADWYENKIKPVHNVVAFDGNVVLGGDSVNKQIPIYTFDVNGQVALNETFWNSPRIHQFTSVNSKGRLFRLGRGYLAYVPLITPETGWLPEELLTPLTITVKALPWLNIRSEPGINGEVIGRAAWGSKMLTYEATMSVNGAYWARISDNGWVALYYPGQGQLTDWKDIK